ncbi:hypothetical protein CIB95_08680 [Lottiidibacillus patelloidae]|uniref:Uncharacterized protein n=1 Tax=Lottiidibacillus patelloidae TaxID=2670334 RepID=A0A263BU27_9BACI|nr:hypothetical protein [Lottiidibacillus patelloidae]OZM56837.1 hypothetical protein CIB95_08680 [Lottiidibacillus patelloidae]
MKKIKITLLSLVLVLLSSLLVVAYYYTDGFDFKDSDGTGDTIEEALVNFSEKRNLSFGEIIKEVYVDQETKLIFYMDRTQYSLSASIVKQKWNGKWKVLVVSANQLLEQIEDHPYSWGGFSDDETIMGYWGIIYYENVEKMVVKKNKEIEIAEMFQHPNLPRVWYKFYDVTDPYIRNISFWPEDANGNEVPW